MTKIRLNFSQSIYQSLLNKPIDARQFIAEVLGLPKGNPHLDALTLNLRFNHAAEGGSPEITNLEVINAVYDEATQTGWFEISYQVERHYTCSDVKSQQKHTEVCPFEINPTEQLLVLQIPEDESRDTVFEL